MIDIWITKYVLTDGIKHGRAYEISSDGWAKATDQRIRVGSPYWLIHSRYFCLNAEDAVLAAEKMRAKKIASLKKQITQLEALEFKITGDAK